MRIERLENRIINGDSSEVLRKFPSNSIDLVVTSPPYDSLRDYTGEGGCFKKIARQLYRVLAPGGVMVWVVGD